MKKVICILSLSLLLAACGNDDNNDVSAVPTERITGDTYNDLSSPLVKNSSQYDHVTKWWCVYFGEYPTNEVVADAFQAVDDYAIQDGDVIQDSTLYARLQQAAWIDNDTEIDGKRYHRMTGDDAVSASTDRDQHYRWADTGEWHYFAYEPIKWRILKISGSKAVLMTDRMPDTCPYNDVAEDVNWDQCLLRKFLNDEFYNRAFTEEERKAVLLSDVENLSNYYYGTYCGPDTEDYVYILSESEVFSSSLAEDYGFYPGDGIDDSARRFRSTMYAKCRGAWWSPVDGYKGNSFWFMRSNGYAMSNVTYVCDFGYLYNRGTVVTCDDAAIVAVIDIDLSKADYTVATTVLSTDVNW